MGIGDRIRQIRGEDFQAKFAENLGLHKNTVGKWERGESVPDANNLAKILEVYPEINPAWLITGEGDMKYDGGVDSSKADWEIFIDRRGFLNHVAIIDYYLNSKYYKDIQPKIMALIYSTFHELIKNNKGFSPKDVCDIISDLYTPSFYIFDLEITELVANLASAKFKNKGNKFDKNKFYWETMDQICNKFCDNRVIAPISMKSKITDWIKSEISKED